MSKNLSTHEAWERAALYLSMCSGFPKDAKYTLLKTSQDYIEPLNQHKLVFTLMVDHPANIRAGQTLAEKAVEPIGPYYAKKQSEEHEPFKLLRELIDILELQTKEQRLKTGKTPFSGKKEGA